MSDTPLKRWLKYLETLHPNPMDLGLERVGLVARTLGLLPVAVPVVTVAGTNGKGSTVAVLEALLRACGHRAGTFTSPHLVRFNERIRIAGREADDSAIVAAFEAIEAARGETTLTYFEFALLAALWVFRESQADHIVLEVGLGGRLDAANIVDADVAVITSIDLDHQQWLGDSRGAIAREKAGILRPGRPAVIAEPDPPGELLAAAAETAVAPLSLIGRDFFVRAVEPGAELSVCRRSGESAVFSVAHPDLLPANIAAALQAAALLDVPFDAAAVSRALAAVSVRGRRQSLVVEGNQYLLDVAHNPAAVVKLLDKLAHSRCRGRRIALFSAMSDKAVAEMLGLCATQFDYWLLPDQPDNPRAMPAAQVAALLGAIGVTQCETCEDIPAAQRRCAQMLGAGDLAVVFGSFFTVGAVLATLEEA